MERREHGPQIEMDSQMLWVGAETLNSREEDIRVGYFVRNSLNEKWKKLLLKGKSAVLKR